MIVYRGYSYNKLITLKIHAKISWKESVIHRFNYG